jgi:hypothetical protein
MMASEPTPVYKDLLNNQFSCTARCDAGSLEALFTVAPKHITLPVPVVAVLQVILLCTWSHSFFQSTSYILLSLHYGSIQD